MSKPTKEIWLYGGTVRVRFYEDKHKYTVALCPDGVCGTDVYAVSVTRITGTLDKSGPLVGWATKLVTEEAEAVLKMLKDSETVPGAAFIKQHKPNIRWAHREAMEAAQQFGTDFHEWVEELVNARIDDRSPGKLPPGLRMKRCAKGYLAWEADHEIEYMFAERLVYSVEHHYTGTVDIGARVDGNQTIIDVKTSKNIYESHRMQIEAYKRAMNEEDEYGEFTHTGIIQVPRETGIWTWHDITRKSKFDLQIAGDWDAFLACRKLYHWLHEMKEGG